MTQPVSVQICTLNEEQNIGACLDAILLNDPEEILVIDGGSNDRTVDIAASKGARVLRAGKLGLGPSRQLGYQAATAPYSAFVDADDRIGADWIAAMIRETKAGGYSALQSSLRAVDTGSWWSRGWNQYFIESVRPTADTSMVGRPAMFVTADLLRVDDDLISLDEDTHLSRHFEKLGLRQGIGTAVACRHVDETRAENFKKWQSYGRGYRGFVNVNPDRRAAIVRHMVMTIPFARSWRPVLRGHLDQPVFGMLMAANVFQGWLAHSGPLETPKASAG